jgi:hypothetical protein
MPALEEAIEDTGHKGIIAILCDQRIALVRDPLVQRSCSATSEPK